MMGFPGRPGFQGVGPNGYGFPVAGMGMGSMMPGGMTPGMPGAQPMGAMAGTMTPMMTMAAMNPMAMAAMSGGCGGCAGMVSPNPVPVQLQPANPAPATATITSRQKQFMTKIVTAMGAGDIGTVASTLSDAVTSKVSMPDQFLDTVKQWMTSRQESSKASAELQMQASHLRPQQDIAAQAQRPANAGKSRHFMQLEQQLNSAIATGDERGVNSVLGRAAELATSGTPGAPSLGATPTLPGAVTPGLPGDQTPAFAGGRTPPLPQQVRQWHTQQLRQPPKAYVPQPEPPSSEVPTIPTTSAPTIPTVPSASVPSGGDVPTKKAEDDIGAFADTWRPSQVAPPIDVKAKDGDQSVGDMHFRGATSPERFVSSRSSRQPAYEPTVEEIAEVLGQTEAESATYSQICKKFKPKAASQHVRRIVEANSNRFTVLGDKVTLRDPQKKEALQCLIKELVRTPLQRAEVNPEEACEAIWCAAHFALQASPADVCKVLLTVARTTLRKKGKVEKGMYPAAMPLAVACIIDRVVLVERQQGLNRRFENSFSPHLHSMIFHKWTMGAVHGSQFLANLLLTWDKLGFFQAKHIEQCKKSLFLLIAYARFDGVPDPPDKELGTGWYKVVKREAGEEEGSEALLPRKLLEAPTHVGEDMDDEEKVFGSPPAPETKAADDEEEQLFGSDAPPAASQEVEKPEEVTPHQAQTPQSTPNMPAGEGTPGLTQGAPTPRLQEAAGDATPLIGGATPRLPEDSQQFKDTIQYADADAGLATQPYPIAASQGASLPATQAYQDEPAPKRARVDQGPA
eukprot:TRINITY_DN50166_c0_g1_i1.p1 TRINITY_DN50166_c0_g1~~TRINITY_DN50166_c0_g1_i1.p1  ORF type:complete len:797 (+),score=153.88 TRINITY_DN50166_c0_g1_i1:66-2456(+)